MEIVLIVVKCPTQCTVVGDSGVGGVSVQCRVVWGYNTVTDNAVHQCKYMIASSRTGFDYNINIQASVQW